MPTIDPQLKQGQTVHRSAEIDLERHNLDRLTVRKAESQTGRNSERQKVRKSKSQKVSKIEN